MRLLFITCLLFGAVIASNETFVCEEDSHVECPSKMCFYTIIENCVVRGCATVEQCGSKAESECFKDGDKYTCCCSSSGCTSNYKGSPVCDTKTENVVEEAEDDDEDNTEDEVMATTMKSKREIGDKAPAPAAQVAAVVAAVEAAVEETQVVEKVEGVKAEPVPEAVPAAPETVAKVAEDVAKAEEVIEEPAVLTVHKPLETVEAAAESAPEAEHQKVVETIAAAAPVVAAAEKSSEETVDKKTEEPEDQEDETDAGEPIVDSVQESQVSLGDVLKPKVEVQPKLEEAAHDVPESVAEAQQESVKEDEKAVVAVEAEKTINESNDNPDQAVPAESLQVHQVVAAVPAAANNASSVVAEPAIPNDAVPLVVVSETNNSSAPAAAPTTSTTSAQVLEVVATTLAPTTTTVAPTTTPAATTTRKALIAAAAVAAVAVKAPEPKEEPKQEPKPEVPKVTNVPVDEEGFYLSQPLPPREKFVPPPKQPETTTPILITSSVKAREMETSFGPPIPWWSAVLLGLIISVAIAWVIRSFIVRRRAAARRNAETSANRRPPTKRNDVLVDPLLLNKTVDETSPQ